MVGIEIPRQNDAASNNNGQSGTGGGWCPVCGSMQAVLSQHMTRHSKDEIIRAISTGQPLSQLGPRSRTGRPPRRLSHSSNVTSPSIISRPQPSTSPTSILPHALPTSPTFIVPGTQQNMSDQIASVVPSLANDGQPIQIGSIVHQQHNNLPMQHAQHQFSSGNGVLFIGNGLIQTPQGLLPNNNFQLQNNGISYIIPTNGNLMLSPGSNQTLIIPSTSNIPTSVAVKQNQIPSSSTTPTITSVSPLMRITNSTSQPNCHPASYQNSGLFNSQFDYVDVNNSTSSTETHQVSRAYKQEQPAKLNSVDSLQIHNKKPKNHDKTVPCSSNKYKVDDKKTTIQVGKNISISIPEDLAGKKERLKEIINQELVRAILLNDSEESQNNRKENDESDDEVVDLKIDSDGVKEDDPYIQNEEKVDLSLICQIENDKNNQSNGKSKKSEENNMSTVNSVSNPSVSENSCNPGLSGIHKLYPVHQPLNSFNNNQHLSNDTSHLSGSDVKKKSDPSTTQFKNNSSFTLMLPTNSNPQYVNASGKETRENSGIDLGSGLKSLIITSVVSCPQEESSSVPTSEPSNVCYNDVQSLGFFQSDRSLTSLLGEATLSHMAYGEEQVLGAVEEVFSSEVSNLPASCSSTQQLKSESTDMDSYQSNMVESANNMDVECTEQYRESNNFRDDKKVSTSHSYSSPTTNTGVTTQSINNIGNMVIQNIDKKLEKLSEQENEDLADDPDSDEDFSNSNIFTGNSVFDCELSGASTQHEEVMSLKASETLADSDSERASPPHEISDVSRQSFTRFTLIYLII